MILVKISLLLVPSLSKLHLCHIHRKQKINIQVYRSQPITENSSVPLLIPLQVRPEWSITPKNTRGIISHPFNMRQKVTTLRYVINK